MWPFDSINSRVSEDNPLIPLDVSRPLDNVNRLSSSNLRFQSSFEGRNTGVTLAPQRQNWASAYFQSFPPQIPLISRCETTRENFDFNTAVFHFSPPVAPTINCFTGSLPERTGWFTSTLTLPGDNPRMALTFRPDAPVSRPRPVVFLLHGTGGGSDSMSHDLFNADEATRIFGNDAIIFILEARHYMPEDWEHYGLSYDQFWNTTGDNGNTNKDILFLQALMNASIRDYGADPGRVFLFGHSNGGFAALHYGMALRNQVRGVIISSAGWVEHPPKRHLTFNTNNCADILRQGLATMTAVVDDWRIDADWGFPFIHRDSSDEIFNEARPISHFPHDGRPAFFIRGNSRDPDVSAYYTCALDDQLRRHGYSEVQTNIIDTLHPTKPEEGHHFIDSSMVEQGWAWALSLPRIPPR